MQHLNHLLLNSETFPFFDFAHNLLASVEVRNELDKDFAKTHTFSSWLFTMIFIFSGSMSANFLLGEPVISPLSNNKLFLATMIWFLAFLGPFNILYNAGMFLPIRMMASAVNEVYRARKIGYGIMQAAQFYPDSWIVMIAIGAIRANGSGLMKLLIRLFRGTQTHDGFMQLSFTTKISMLAAFFLILVKKTTWLSLDLIQLGIALIFVAIKMASLCNIKSYQYLPFENWFYTMIFPLKESKQTKSDEKIENSKDLKKDE